MYKKFKKLLMSIFDKSIMDWMGTEHEQIDDICIIGVKI